MRLAKLLVLLLVSIAYKFAVGDLNFEEDLVQRLHSPLLWNRLHKSVSHGRIGYEANVNISLMCDTMAVLYESKAISSQLYADLSGLCEQELEQQFIDILDEICQQTEIGTETVTSENVAHSRQRREFVVLSLVSSSVLIGAAGAALLGGISLGAAALGVAVSTMIEQGEQCKRIDYLFYKTGKLMIAVEEIVEQLKRIDKARKVGNQVVYNLAQANQAIQAFREDYARHRTIPRSLLEYLQVKVKLNPMDTAVLKSCSLDRTSKVKKLRMRFFIDQVDTALQFFEAVPFKQLVPNSNNCLIVYTGPNQIIFDSRDQTYCPLSGVTNELPSPYRDIRTVNYGDCYPKKSIVSSFNDLKVECVEEPIDPKSLIKIRQADNSLVIYCSDFSYSRSRQDGSRVHKRCPASVFALPLGAEVVVYVNELAHRINDTQYVIHSNISMAGDLEGMLSGLTDDPMYDHILDMLKEDHQNSHLIRKTGSLIWILVSVFTVLFAVVFALALYLSN